MSERLPGGFAAEILERFGAELTPEERRAVEEAGGASGEIPPELHREPPVLEVNRGDSAEPVDIRGQLAAMTIGQKIKVAMFGSSVCRGLLIRDTNRLVQQFVLKNPRLTPQEIEDFARNPNLSEGVLRTIADTREWMGSYQVKVNLVMNPKTPGDIALKWLRFLNLPELRRIAKSKNLPQLVVVTARKRLEELGRRS